MNTAVGGFPRISAALEERLDQAASVYVRVATAEALARREDGNPGRAVAFLAPHSTRTTIRVRLLPLNAITHLPVGELTPYGDVIDRAASSPDQYIANAGRYLSALVAGTYDSLSPPPCAVFVPCQSASTSTTSIRRAWPQFSQCEPLAAA